MMCKCISSHFTAILEQFKAHITEFHQDLDTNSSLSLGSSEGASRCSQTRLAFQPVSPEWWLWQNCKPSWALTSFWFQCQHLIQTWNLMRWSLVGRVIYSVTSLWSPFAIAGVSAVTPAGGCGSPGGPAVRGDAPGTVTCLCGAVRCWRGRTRRKSKHSVLCGQRFLQDTSGEFSSEKETCRCFSSLIMSVLIKNLKGAGNDCYGVGICSGTAVQCHGGCRTWPEDAGCGAGAAGWSRVGLSARDLRQCSGKLCERVRGGCLCFNSTILIGAALCRFRKVLFTDIFLLSSELCAARMYSGFTSVSAASQVLRTQIPELRYLFPWSVQATAGKDETLFRLIANPYNAGSCSAVHCWVHFF